MTETVRSPGAAAAGGAAPGAGASAVPAETSTQTAWLAAILRPILGFRLRYLPLTMVYFAYGALGLIDVTRDMWIKEQLKLNPSDLASIGVWLSLPWTVKMVFGELVDSVPILGSQRRSYILIGAALTAAGMLTLAGAAGGHLVLARAEHAYLIGALLIVIGTLIQDVVADAMSTEVVARVDEAGNARPEQDIKSELGMVQVLGRLALSFGILAVASFKKEARLFVAFFPEIMKELRIGVGREAMGQFLDAGEEGQQIWLGCGTRHG